MGTALYGDPGLCIRELIQNALDALELRDLRLKLPRKARHEPVDDLDGEELRVELTWGGNPEKGEFICVTDWGVGMTRKVIQDYFTKVGRSYYKSADYRQEQAALARARSCYLADLPVRDRHPLLFHDRRADGSADTPRWLGRERALIRP